MLAGMGTMKAASLLREARTAAGLSQAELAQKAGVTQSVISVYEAGRRQPSVPTLTTLIAATGYELDLSIGKPRRGVQRLTGPVGRRLRRRRSEVLELAGRHGVQVLGVFGSVARGEDRPDSDIDLLVELPDGMGLFAVARVQNELQELLGSPVDLIPEAGLKAGVRPSVEADLVRL
jgi:predicted nucleotidyltransferase/DNA-binding XRE family transcriptional regulator